MVRLKQKSLCALGFFEDFHPNNNNKMSSEKGSVPDPKIDHNYEQKTADIQLQNQIFDGFSDTHLQLSYFKTLLNRENMSPAVHTRPTYLHCTANHRHHGTSDC